MSENIVEDVEMEEEDEAERFAVVDNLNTELGGEEEKGPNVYLPGDPIEDGEELVCDKSAYVMLHQAQTGAPCLSFDIIKDNLGENREQFPHTCFIVAGTQAAQTHINNVIVMKLSNLHKVEDLESSDEDDDEDSDDEEDKKPKMANSMIKHPGCVNRIRAATVDNAVLCATWSETGRVNIFNLNRELQILNEPNADSDNQTVPIFSFSGHQQEGFAIDWSPCMPGVLATGDCKQNIHIWKPTQGSWNVDQRPLIGHTKSVEDLQWSPNERNVLASCSVDKSIRIWDTRAAPQKACMLACNNAHESDINVISWNRNEPFIASGGDDGFLHIWDLRQFESKTPVATFKHHTEPVTTVEWHPTEATVFASGGADNQIALWDLSVEKDTEDNTEDIQEIPPQLLFIHQGQYDIKELHWHPQITGTILSTAHSGFNIFRTISV